MIINKKMTDIKNKVIREAIYNDVTKTITISRYYRDRHVYSKIGEIIINNIDSNEAEIVGKSNIIAHVFSAMSKHNIYSVTFENRQLFHKQNVSKLINLRHIVHQSNNKIKSYTVNAIIGGDINKVNITYNGIIETNRIGNSGIIKFSNVTEGYVKRLFTSIVTSLQNNVNVLEVDINKRVNTEYIKHIISMIMFKCKINFSDNIYIERYYDNEKLNYKLSYNYYIYIENDIYMMTRTQYKKYVNKIAVHNIDNYDATFEIVKTIETMKKGLKKIKVNKAISGRYIILLTNIGYIVIKNIDKAIKILEINKPIEDIDIITIRYNDNSNESIKKEEIVDNILNNELLNIKDMTIEAYVVT